MDTKNLFDLSREGNFKECVLFYLASVFLIMLSMVSILYAMYILGINDLYWVIIIGIFYSTIVCSVLSAIIITKKRMWKSFKSYFLLNITVLSGMAGGALLGMVVVSMLYYAPVEGKDL